jgi:hypothetical protein
LTIVDVYARETNTFILFLPCQQQPLNNSGYKNMASVLSGEGEYMKSFPGNTLPEGDFLPPTSVPNEFCSEIQATPEKVDFFRKNGYVTFDNFLNKEQLEYWRKAVTHAVSRRDNSHRFPK